MKTTAWFIILLTVSAAGWIGCYQQNANFREAQDKAALWEGYFMWESTALRKCEEAR